MIFDPTAGIFTHAMDVVFGIDVPNYRESARAGTGLDHPRERMEDPRVQHPLLPRRTPDRVASIRSRLLSSTAPRSWQRFYKIVMPALSPITFFLLVTNLTYAFFEVYATIDFMTKGAPAGKTSVAIYEIIRVGVNNGDLGRGAAQSVLLVRRRHRRHAVAVPNDRQQSQLRGCLMAGLTPGVKRKTYFRGRQWPFHLGLTVTAFVIAFPLLYAALIATQNNTEIFAFQMTPGSALRSNFDAVWFGRDFAGAMWNSTVQSDPGHDRQDHAVAPGRPGVRLLQVPGQSGSCSSSSSSR